MNSVVAPRVSIITVVRNGADNIAKMLDSVTSQRGADVELIVIDGASTDETLKIIKQYASRQLHWVSEQDKGIYDAMNKGISLARGEWIYFLGSDDALADPTVLADVFSARNLESYDLICGYSLSDTGQQYVPRLSWRTNVFNTIHHQAVFYRKRLFDNFRYRTDIPVVADYELNFLIQKQRRPMLLVERCISTCGSKGISRTCSQIAAQIDCFRIRARHISPLLNCLLLTVGMTNLALVKLLPER